MTQWGEVSTEILRMLGGHDAQRRRRLHQGKEGGMTRDDRNPPDSTRRRCSKCQANRPSLGGRTNKLTRLWRCAECLKGQRA